MHFFYPSDPICGQTNYLPEQFYFNLYYRTSDSL